MLIYWCVAGLICLIQLHLPLSEETRSKSNEIINQIPMPEEQTRLLCDILALMLGGILLPIALISDVYKIFTGKDLF